MTNMETLQKSKKELFGTPNLVKMGLLSAVALVLMMLDFALPIFPSFLQLDLSDIPVVIGTLALGPVAGIMIELIKNIIHGIIATTTMGIGEIANFIVGIAYIIPLGIICNKSKSIKNVVIGLILGTLSMTFIACIFNYFIFIPLYSAIVFNLPISAFVDMASKVNSMITDFATMVLFAIAPFNLIKGIIISIFGYYLYKILKPIINRY